MNRIGVNESKQLNNAQLLDIFELNIADKHQRKGNGIMQSKTVNDNIIRLRKEILDRMINPA